MENLSSQMERFGELWRTTFEEILTDDVLSAYTPGVSRSQLNEIVEMVLGYLTRTKAPKGFAPTFHLAKALASVSVLDATNALKRIRSGEHDDLSAFVAAVNRILSAFHSLFVYSDKHESAAMVVDLSSQLRESIGVIDTAQGELAAKVELLSSAEQQANKISAAAVTIEAQQTKCTEMHDDILDSQQKAVALLDEMAAHDEKAAAFENEAEKNLGRYRKLLDDLEAQKAVISALSVQNKSQSELIEALLPKGASAGLAAAFAERRIGLEKTKWIWMGAFILSIACLGISTFHLISLLKTMPADPNQVLREMLYRLPLLAPFVWLGWFSAIQYGNTIRVQEDYAFKEATSKAFAGYRDHMEHLAAIDSEDGESAMNLLAAKTIEVLAREPLRIYRRSNRDVSPTSELAAFIESYQSGRKSNKKAKSETDDA
jgi:hypothetical protein